MAVAGIQQTVREHMITERDIYKMGYLAARPENSKKQATSTGVHALKLDSKRDGYIYIPKTYVDDRPAALAVMLHGMGGQAGHGLALLRQYADDNNLILLAPSSRSGTWDVIANKNFGLDVLFIDQALQIAFERYAIDTSRIAIGGFSDGASYALCLGLTNGDLFTHIIAFSPGFVYAVEKRGKPAVFISHGHKDRILPIDPCSRHIVPQLQQEGFDVLYQEFDGAHEITSGVTKAAVEWFGSKDR